MSGIYCVTGLGKTPIDHGTIEGVAQASACKPASAWLSLEFSNAPWLRIGVHDRPGVGGNSPVHTVEGERLCGVIYGAYPTTYSQEPLCLDECGSELCPDRVLGGLRKKYKKVFESWEEGGCIVLTETGGGRVLGFCDWWGQERLYYKEAGNCVLLSNDDYTVASWRQTKPALDDEQCKKFLREGVWGRDGISLYGSKEVKLGNFVIVDLHDGCKLSECSDELSDLTGDPVGECALGEILEDLWNGVIDRCRSYAASGETLALSLTGGVDSRLVLGALTCEKIDCELATFVSSENVTRDEAIANQIATAVGKKLNRIEVGHEFFKNYLDYHRQAVRTSAGAMGREGALELYCNQRMAELGRVRLTGNHAGEILRDVPSPNIETAEVPGFRRDWLDGDSAMEAVAKTISPPNLLTLEGKLNYLREGFPFYYYDNRMVERSQVYLVSPYLNQGFVRRLLTNSKQFLRREDFLSIILSNAPELALFDLDRHGVRVVGNRASFQTRWIHNLTFKLEYLADYGMPSFRGAEPLTELLRRFESRLLGRHKFSHFRKWFEGPLSQPLKEALLDPSFLNDPRIDKVEVERIVRDHVERRRNHTAAIHKLIWFAVSK